VFPQYSMSTSPAAIALAAILALGLTACGGPLEPAPVAAVPAADPTGVDAAGDAAAAAEDEPAALAAREQALADQEADLALREREAELARREAELAAARRTQRTGQGPGSAEVGCHAQAGIERAGCGGPGARSASPAGHRSGRHAACGRDHLAAIEQDLGRR